MLPAVKALPPRGRCHGAYVARIHTQARGMSGINHGDSGGPLVWTLQPYNIIAVISTGDIFPKTDRVGRTCAHRRPRPDPRGHPVPTSMSCP